MVGPGVAEDKAKGVAMTYKNLVVETPKRILMQTRALGVRVPFEDMQDDQTGALKRLAEAVGRSHRVAQELVKANVFNGAFGTFYRTGYDGLALCSTSHTLEVDRIDAADTDLSALPTRDTGTWSNRLATDADLDHAALQDAITLMRRTVGREGDLIILNPRTLLVPPEIEPTAWTLINSQGRSDTANRAESDIPRHGINIVSSPFLYDSDAWFVIADQHDLQYFLRMEMATRKRSLEGTWDEAVESMMRDGVGFHDPRGVVGTTGA
jgi:phage major head subunit gpT-like protein